MNWLFEAYQRGIQLMPNSGYKNTSEALLWITHFKIHVEVNLINDETNVVLSDRAVAWKQDLFLFPLIHRTKFL